MANPFLIEPPASFGFSTGRSSAYCLYKIIEAYGGVDSRGNVDGSVLPEGFEVNFENTGHEREESLVFGHQIESRWNVKVNWLEWFDEFNLDNYRTKSGDISERRKHYGPGDWGFRIVSYETASRYSPLNPFPHTPYMNLIIYKATYRRLIKNAPPVLPNIRQSICTGDLKIKTDKRFMKSLGFDRWNAITGIRFDEPDRYADRMRAQAKGDEPFDSYMPLYDARITQEDVQRFWHFQPFNLGIPSSRGNCNLCFKKTFRNIVETMEETDEFDMFWIWAEEFTGQVFKRDRPNYAEIRRMITERDPKIERFLQLTANEQPRSCFCA